MRKIIYLPEGAGPCAKMHVEATVVAMDGTKFVSTNFCMNPQEVCPRGDMPSGVGYELCKSVCQQEGHAEVNAIKAAGASAKGSLLELRGHTYACDNCKSCADDNGVEAIVVFI